MEQDDGMERDLSRRKETQPNARLSVWVGGWVDVVCMRVYVCGRLRETIDKYVTVGRKRARPGYGIGIRTAVLRLCVWEPDVKCGWDG